MSKFSQMFPPAPAFTERELPDQTGKVFIITGASSGIGLELAKILHAANATLYLAARSSSKLSLATETIRSSSPKSQGRIESLVVDVSDLSSIKPCVQQFLARETRLDGLVHNAGVMNTPPDARTKQGHELQIATHVLGPFLTTSLLEGVLGSTAGSRVVWVSSMISVGAPRGGVIWDEERQRPVVVKAGMDNYMQSKVGSVFLAGEFAKRWGGKGVISVSVHPGLMRTDLQKNMPAIFGVTMGLLFKGPKFGAYSQLFGLLSPEVTPDKNGSFIIPWGRFGEIPADIAAGMEDGGSGLSGKLWAWCEKETTTFR
ncbi:hypothetical protein QBC47DRAFT_455871 [Echria macrotheca]|uniref:NAD(P)-binding protein n=1 Tax=Echria macrotheca TaxID=438768 RepID=A0AAJ0BN17_9PEZI|nr:hypothetical protein QBC47DRAFT_455871 [Echria macrotheca]